MTDPNLVSALNYTLSTIAQALAAAMALLAAITLYALQALDAKCTGAHLAVYGSVPLTNDLHSHAHLREWPKYLVALVAHRDNYRATFYKYDQMLDDVCELLPRLIDAERRLRIFLIIALGSTAAVMALSVLNLAQVPDLVSTGFGKTVLSSNVAGFIACLGTYALLIWEIVHPPRRK